MGELINRELIVERPDVGTGCLKTTAIEVKAFPDFDFKNNVFIPSTKKRHSHRTYIRGVDKYINIPGIIVDDGYLKDISVQEIFALLLLYSKTDLISLRGVDHNFIYKFNSSTTNGYRKYRTFGERFSKAIYNKNCVKADLPDRYKIKEASFQGNLTQAIDELIRKELFELIPIQLYADPEDPDITKIVNEAFKGIVPIGNNSEDKYLFLEPDENIKVIWILRPKLMVKNPEYEIYKKIHQAIYNFEYNQYNYEDLGTNLKLKAELIREEDFSSYLQDWKSSLYEKVEPYLDCPSDEDIDRIIEILPNYVYSVYMIIFKEEYL